MDPHAIWQGIDHNWVAIVISLFALGMSYLADSRARKSVRPYVSTGVHIALDDMSVSLGNYGVGTAIVTRIAFSRGELQSRNALAPALPASQNYGVQSGVIFVQDRYYLRPGDRLPLASAEATNTHKVGDALQDWIKALNNVKIAVDYLDIFGKKFHYERTITINADNIGMV